MIEINTMGAFIGMGILVFGVAILWLLADKGDKKQAKKRKYHLHSAHHHK